ncbi:hypothetical protein BDV98DRAFT_593464 [Pterulicium gracile]|uniref:Uncharacterized protein n=1 Tax=Pterulicium gracile TaxID=1884261 RepID=A0A5C3QG29_9AGAR|nr:hypothetical protein BDV98DRAFT_593464 [Pterula gracilis]
MRMLLLTIRHGVGMRKWVDVGLTTSEETNYTERFGMIDPNDSGLCDDTLKGPVAAHAFASKSKESAEFKSSSSSPALSPPVTRADSLLNLAPAHRCNVVTDKDPRRPAAHEVIKGQFNKLVGATRRGSAELSELVFSRRASDATAAPMKMRTRTKSYQHKIKARTPLPAPAKSSRKSRTIAHVALVQKRDRFCHAIQKDLRPGMVKRGLQPLYHVHYALRAEVIKGELRMTLETIDESD